MCKSHFDLYMNKSLIKNLQNKGLVNVSEYLKGWFKSTDEQMWCENICVFQIPLVWKKKSKTAQNLVRDQLPKQTSGLSEAYLISKSNI